TNKLLHCRILLGVVFDDQKLLGFARDEILDLIQRFPEGFLRDRFSDKVDSPEFESTLAIVISRNDLYGNVPEFRIDLQLSKYLGTVDHRKLHVENDRIRFIMPSIT